MGRAVSFDVDGTLIDSNDYHARAWQETFARYGVDTTFEKVRAQIGKGGDQLLPVFVPKEMIDRVGEQMKDERTAYFKGNRSRVYVAVGMSAGGALLFRTA